MEILKVIQIEAGHEEEIEDFPKFNLHFNFKTTKSPKEIFKSLEFVTFRVIKAIHETDIENFPKFRSKTIKSLRVLQIETNYKAKI